METLMEVEPTREIAFASPTGAACTEFAEMATVKTAAGRTTPRFVKNNRSFSTARFTRLLAVSSLVRLEQTRNVKPSLNWPGTWARRR
jgi:hypothetical protein